jgi:phosphonopyruvate decarboxylase
MGQITQKLLSVIEIEHAAFPKTAEELPTALHHAVSSMAERELPFAFVMEGGSVRDDGLDPAPERRRAAGRREDLNGSGELPSRAAVLDRFLTLVDPAAAVITTTGKCGRELFTLADRPQHLYQVGSMGGASGMGLGVALNVSRPVVVLDGDGAALMKLGSFATIGAYAPPGLIHIVLDNGVHDSTGGQRTVSSSVDFAGVGLACGYRYAVSCRTLDGFASAYCTAAAGPKPALIHARIAPGSMSKLGRPTVAPADVARRFKAFLTQRAASSALPLVAAGAAS